MTPAAMTRSRLFPVLQGVSPETAAARIDVLAAQARAARVPVEAHARTVYVSGDGVLCLRWTAIAQRIADSGRYRVREVVAKADRVWLEFLEREDGATWSWAVRCESASCGFRESVSMDDRSERPRNCRVCTGSALASEIPSSWRWLGDSDQTLARAFAAGALTASVDPDGESYDPAKDPMPTLRRRALVEGARAYCSPIFFGVAIEGEITPDAPPAPAPAPTNGNGHGFAPLYDRNERPEVARVVPPDASMEEILDLAPGDGLPATSLEERAQEVLEHTARTDSVVRMQRPTQEQLAASEIGNQPTVRAALEQPAETPKETQAVAAQPPASEDSIGAGEVPAQPSPANHSTARDLWRVTTKGDQEARAFFDGHYSRQTPGSPHWLRPGFNFVLRADDAEGRIVALFAWWRPKWEHGTDGTTRKDGLRALECTVFRRLGGPLASDLIKAAEEALGWPEAEQALHLKAAGPVPLLLTGVSSEATVDRRSRHSEPGQCFRAAGWVTSTKIASPGSTADTWLDRPWSNPHDSTNTDGAAAPLSPAAPPAVDPEGPVPPSGSAGSLLCTGFLCSACGGLCPADAASCPSCGKVYKLAPDSTAAPSRCAECDMPLAADSKVCPDPECPSHNGHPNEDDACAGCGNVAAKTAKSDGSCGYDDWGATPVPSAPSPKPVYRPPTSDFAGKRSMPAKGKDMGPCCYPGPGCSGRITGTDQYHAGARGRRAHVACAARERAMTSEVTK